jgi:hypothetical protein
MIGNSSRQQPANQIACDVAGDVGRKRTRRISRARVLAEIGEGQGECGRHAHPLHDPQQRENRQVGRAGEQGRGNCKHNQRDENTPPPIYVSAEVGDSQAGDRHRQRARVDGETHRPGGDAVMARERGQDGLRCKQVDDCEECGQRNDEEAKQEIYGRMRFRGRIKCIRHLRHDLTLPSGSGYGVMQSQQAPPRSFAHIL